MDEKKKPTIARKRSQMLIAIRVELHEWKPCWPHTWKRSWVPSFALPTRAPRVFKTPSSNLKMESACAVTNFVVDSEIIKTETLPRVTWTIEIARCKSFLENHNKVVKNCLGRPFWRSHPTPCKMTVFAHFLSTFSSVQKEKCHFWPCFWAIFYTAAWPPGNRFFDILKKKFNIR